VVSKYACQLTVECLILYLIILNRIAWLDIALGRKAVLASVRY